MNDKNPLFDKCIGCKEYPRNQRLSSNPCNGCLRNIYIDAPDRYKSKYQKE